MILALAPHTDDVCLGAGGYIARAVERCHDVKVVAFSTGNPEDGSNATEFKDAMGILGVKRFIIYEFETRAFPENRQDILWRIELNIKRERPRTLIIPAAHNHQDHRVVNHEARRIGHKYNVNIIAYAQAWSQTMCPFQPAAYASLAYRHLATKIKALQAYKSQAFRPYMDLNYQIANALYWGGFARTRFAEPFEVIQWDL